LAEDLGFEMARQVTPVIQDTGLGRYGTRTSGDRKKILAEDLGFEMARQVTPVIQDLGFEMAGATGKLGDIVRF
jgi:hypothetical protein